MRNDVRDEIVDTTFFQLSHLCQRFLHKDIGKLDLPRDNLLERRWIFLLWAVIKEPKDKIILRLL